MTTEIEIAFDPIKELPAEPPKGLASLPPKRFTVVQELADQLPLNDLGLPTYIYRTDLIPGDLNTGGYTADERLGLLDAAAFQLDYYEGYPAQPDASPFWAKLSFEPAEAFMLFIEYLGIIDMQDGEGNLVSPIRTFYSTAQRTSYSEEQLKEYAYLYYWNYRAKAFDMYTRASFQKQKEVRALVLEDVQFKVSSKIAGKFNERLVSILDGSAENAADLMDEMSVKDLMTVMTKAMELQRISAGLPGNGPSTNSNNKEEVAQGASLANRMRTVAKKAGEESRSVDTSIDSINVIMEDEDKLAKLQGMILESQEKVKR